jgi:peptidoglycan/LPS O-acetylase OafA/YrhL
MILKYRPEIDGLRAISVLGVIFYHANIFIYNKRFFSGGFLGVDIFFVISGYLISSLIINELYNSANFNFFHFYKKRIRRILPAFLFVIFFSFPIAYLLLLPNNFVEYCKSIISAILFSSNFFFYFSEIQYSAQVAFYKPLLHTWSLSIEEQFYIFFPIFLFFFYKFFKKVFFELILIIFFLSLLSSEFLSKNSPELNFYTFTSRIWELLFGFILAYITINKKLLFINYKIKNILSIIGFALIIIPFFYYDEQMLLPSIKSILPVIGAGLVIYFSDNNIIYKLLCSKPLVFIGLISYSLYLWHYPIFSFYRIYNLSHIPSLHIKIFIVLIIFLLSVFTFFFIEKPFKDPNRVSWKIVSKVVIFFYFFLFLLSFYIITKKGLPERFPKNLVDLQINRNEEGIFSIYNPNGKKKIIFVGDSHIRDIGLNARKNLIERNYTVILTQDNFYLPKFYKVNIKTSKYDLDAYKKIDIIRKFLLNNSDSIIVYGGRFPAILSNKYFNNNEGGLERESLDMEFKFVSENNSQNIKHGIISSVNEIANNNIIFIIYPIPEVGWDVPKRYNYLMKSNNRTNNIISTDYSTYLLRNKDSFELLNSIKSKNIVRIYPHMVFCNSDVKGRCVANNKDGLLYYYDSNHPSIHGADKINKLILDKLDAIHDNKIN